MLGIFMVKKINSLFSFVLATRNLGLCYEYGKGYSPNLELATEYYKKAALQGDAFCNYFIKFNFDNF